MSYIFRKEGEISIEKALYILKNKFEEYTTENIEIKKEGIYLNGGHFDIFIQKQFINEIKEEFGYIEIHLFENWKLFGDQGSYISIEVENK